MTANTAGEGGQAHDPGSARAGAAQRTRRAISAMVLLGIVIWVTGVGADCPVAPSPPTGEWACA
jgi:hypothetical protein